MRIRTAVLAAVLVLVTLVLASALGAIYGIVNRSAKSRLQADLERDRQLWEQLHQERLVVQRSQVRVVAEEPRVKAVMTTPDVNRETIMDVAQEISHAASADLFLILDANGRLLGDANHPEKFGEDMSGSPLVRQALEKGASGGFWTQENKVYEAELKNISFGEQIFGVIVVGHALDEKLAKEVAKLTGGIVAVTVDGKVVASSETADAAPAILAYSGGTLSVSGQEYLGVAMPLEGSAKGQVILARSLTDALAPGRRVVMILAIAGMVALLLTIFLAVGLSSRVAGPIERLVTFTGRVGAGDLKARTGDLGSFMEMSVLGKAMNSMIEKLEVSEANLAEKNRLEQEMGIAKDIQLSVLPKDMRVEGLEVSAFMKPAEQVGGDYYDVLPVEDGAWIGIGDVAGHGLKAGLIGLMVQSVVSTLARHPLGKGLTPREQLLVLNRVIHENVKQRMGQQEIVTFTLIRYTRGGKLVFAGAHEDILIRRARTGKVQQIPTPGTWIGAIKDIESHTLDSEEKLQKGDVMVVYSDGVTEAMNDANQQFGIERLCDELEKAPNGSCEQIREYLLAKVHAWMKDQRDDISLVVMRYQGSTNP